MKEQTKKRIYVIALASSALLAAVYHGYSYYQSREDQKAALLAPVAPHPNRAALRALHKKRQEVVKVAPEPQNVQVYTDKTTEQVKKQVKPSPLPSQTVSPLALVPTKATQSEEKDTSICRRYAQQGQHRDLKEMIQNPSRALREKALHVVLLCVDKQNQKELLPLFLFDAQNFKNGAPNTLVNNAIESLKGLRDTSVIPSLCRSLGPKPSPEYYGLISRAITAITDDHIDVIQNHCGTRH